MRHRDVVWIGGNYDCHHIRPIDNDHDNHDNGFNDNFHHIIRSDQLKCVGRPWIEIQAPPMKAISI